jgi:hypothetical protein
VSRWRQARKGQYFLPRIALNPHGYYSALNPNAAGEKPKLGLAFFDSFDIIKKHRADMGL